MFVGMDLWNSIGTDTSIIPAVFPGIPAQLGIPPCSPRPLEAGAIPCLPSAQGMLEWHPRTQKQQREKGTRELGKGRDEQGNPDGSKECLGN